MNDLLKKKLEQGREYRKSLEFKAVLEEQNESKIVEGYATTFNDVYTLFEDDEIIFNERVSARAFDGCDMTDTIMQYDHEGRVFARVSNGTLQLSVDEHGLLCRADLGGTQLGRDLYDEIQGGYTTKMSFGFIVSGEEYEETRQGDKVVVLRTITKVSKLFDVSCVSLPANDMTEISARNKVEGVIDRVQAERLVQEQRKKQIQRIRILAEIEKGQD